jgi:predicted Zn-dependent protease
MGIAAAVNIKNILIILVLTVALGSSLNIPLLAQDTLDVDQAFLQARELAFNGKRSEARQLARRILRKSPGYTDVKILIGRTYTWDRQYDSARTVLVPLTQTTPPKQDALNALIDLETWSDHPYQAIIYADQALALEPSSLEIKLKKVRALRDLQEYKAASAFINTMLQKHPVNAEVLR